MLSPSSSDFFREIAKRYLPQPGGMQQRSPLQGFPQSSPMGGVGSYGQLFQSFAPSYMKGQTFRMPASWSGSPGAYDPGMEARMSSGDRYAHLTSDPFAKGPGTGGFLNISP